jgi:hypothetical protein
VAVVAVAIEMLCLAPIVDRSSIAVHTYRLCMIGSNATSSTCSAISATETLTYDPYYALAIPIQSTLVVQTDTQCTV